MKRLVSIIGAIFLLALSCGLIAIIVWNFRVTDTQIAEAQETIVATTSVAQTLTASAPTVTLTPTITLTPSLTPTSTPTSTPSPIPQACEGTIVIDSILYQRPSRGSTEGSRVLNEGTKVLIRGRVESETFWYPVQLPDTSTKGWLEQDSLSLSEACTDLVTLPFINYFDLAQDRILLADPFISNLWIADQGDPSARISSKPLDRYGNQDFVLPLALGAPEHSQLIRLADPIQAGDFILMLSLDRQSSGYSSYFSIRFRVTDQGQSYYELRMLREHCNIMLLRHTREGGDTVVRSFQYDEAIGCGSNDSQEEYIQIQLIGTEFQGMYNNEPIPLTSVLDASEGPLSFGSVELVAYQTAVELYYLLLVSP